MCQSGDIHSQFVYIVPSCGYQGDDFYLGGGGAEFGTGLLCGSPSAIELHFKQVTEKAGSG